MKHFCRHAFSLVELSIVLVILGLLTGGILTGQSLIRAAELRAILTEKDRYIAAANTFRGKYLALPGDLTNATDFWGDISAAVPGFCKTHTGEPSYVLTCNGNGNGRVGPDPYEGTFPNGSMEIYESIYFWRHLSNAGMIEGNYTGEQVWNTASMNITIPLYWSTSGGKLVPDSRAGLNWYVGNTRLHAALYNTGFEREYGNYLLRGTYEQPGGTSTRTLRTDLSVEEVWSLDKKVDDGKPGLGKVMTYPTGCTYIEGLPFVLNTYYAQADYLLSEESIKCGVIFAFVF